MTSFQYHNGGRREGCLTSGPGALIEGQKRDGKLSISAPFTAMSLLRNVML